MFVHRVRYFVLRQFGNRYPAEGDASVFVGGMFESLVSGFEKDGAGKPCQIIDADELSFVVE